MKKLFEEFSAKIDPLRPIMERAATVHSPLKEVFLSCLKAAFVKAFEFVDMATKQKDDKAFFSTPALRGIAEDIIYFRFLSNLPPETREQVITRLQLCSVKKCLEQQKSFFEVFRPSQPIVPIQITSADEHLCKLNLFWKKNGWSNLNKNKLTPPVREIAKELDSGILEVVYDFIYRLTSKIVHFNPHILLKSGWGPSDSQITFSFKNMDRYYSEINQIYGSYLLCLYFELFGQSFNLKQKEKIAVKELRKHLLDIFRWPEMITFEEMNHPLPPVRLKPNLSVAQVLEEEGFISGAKKILNDKGDF